MELTRDLEPPGMGFRPEIQGLRAVAVALVVGFHLWPDALPGGYIGVDVFFVISGFLITGHLFSEVERTSRISLAGFWARRIRRLLPAASLVLFASLLTMFAVVPRSLWQQTVVQIGASALYAQNWVLAASSVDYLAASGTPTLVQHFWSLSVEEQFYLAWPLLLILSVLVLGRRRRGAVIALGTVFVASLAVSVAQMHDPAGYFSTATRAWEFAAGGLVALLPWLSRWLGRSGIRGAGAAWIGYGLIGASAVVFNSSTPFPGAFAAIPVAGAALVIAAGTSGLRWSANRLASAPPIQAVGDLSYSIYLWHWPLIVAIPYLVTSGDGGWWRVAVIPLSLALAWLTKRFVEDPVRVRAGVPLRPGRSYLAGLTAVTVIVLGAASTWTLVQSSNAASADNALEQFASDPCYGAAALANGCAQPFAVTDRVDTAFAAQDRGALALPCNSYDTSITECEFGDLQNPDYTIAIVGNSHAASLMAGFEAYGLQHHWRIVLMRKTDCLGVSTLPLGQPAGPTGAAWTSNVLAELGSRHDIDAVVFAAHANALHYLAPPKPTEADAAALEQHIAQNFAALVAAGKAVVVVGDTPGSRPTPAPECVYLHRREYDPCASAPTVGMEDANVESLAARDVANVGYLSLLPYLCDARGCHEVIGGAVVYFDDNHLTASFSRSLAPYLGAAVEGQLHPAD